MKPAIQLLALVAACQTSTADPLVVSVLGPGNVVFKTFDLCNGPRTDPPIRVRMSGVPLPGDVLGNAVASAPLVHLEGDRWVELTLIRVAGGNELDLLLPDVRLPGTFTPPGLYDLVVSVDGVGDARLVNAIHVLGCP